MLQSHIRLPTRPQLSVGSHANSFFSAPELLTLAHYAYTLTQPKLVESHPTQNEMLPQIDLQCCMNEASAESPVGLLHGFC